MKNTPASSTIPGFRRLGWFRRLVAAPLLAASFLSSAAFAQTTYTWLNTAPDGNWTQGASGARWNPGGLFDAPGFGVLLFDNNAFPSMTNNVAGTYNMHGLVFGSSATTNRTLTGNTMRLFDNGGADPKIINDSSATHTINFALEGDGDAGDPLKITLNGSGGLTFGGTINNQGSFIDVVGSTATAGVTATLNGVISGSGGLYKANSNTLVILNATNTYSGGTIVDAGTIRIGASSTTNISGVLTGGAFGTGGLTLSNGVTITAVTNASTFIVSLPTVTLKGDVTLGGTTNSGFGSRLQFGSVWDMDGGSRTITLGKPSTSYASGQEAVSFISNTVGSNLFRNGTLILATTSGTTNNPSIARFNTAIFSNNAGLTIGDGVAVTSANGTLFSTASASNAPKLTLNADTSRGGGILELGDGGATMRNATIYSLAGGGTVSARNTTATGQTGTLTINDGGSAVFSGQLVENGNGAIAVIKSGAGTQVFSGSNNYTGLTTVSGGALRIAGANALGATNGGTTVSSGARVELSNGITIVDESLTLNGTGTNSTGALLSVSGNNSYLGLITLGSTSYLGAASGASLVVSNVSGGTSELWVVGDGNTTLAGGATNTGSTSFVKTNTGTAVLLGANNWTGNKFIREGTVVLSNNDAFGSSGTTFVGALSGTAVSTLRLGQNVTNSRAITVEGGGTGVRTLSYTAGTGQGAQLGNLTLNTNSLSINVASGGTLLLGGGIAVTTDAGGINRLALGGGGTLIVTNDGGTGIANSDRYQVRIGDGTLIVGAGSINRRTGVAGLGHGLDLGVDLNGSIVDSASRLYTSNGVTISNAIFVSTTNSRSRIIGMQDQAASSSSIFSGPIGLSGATLTSEAGSNATVTVSGAITNFAGTGNGLIKTGAGTVVLSGGNTYDGGTVISNGTLSINADSRLGTAPGSFTSNHLTLNGGALQTTTSFSVNTNRGVTLGSSGGTIDVASGTQLQITNGSTSQQFVTGTGSLTKSGAGTLALGGSNNYTGGTVLSGGVLRLNASSVVSGGNVIGGALGAGNITINSGTLQGNSQSLYATNFSINGDFAVNAGPQAATGNGRATIGGLFNMGGATRTVSLGRWTNAPGVLQSGIESLRFGNSTDFNANYTNGSLRFVRDANGTASDFVSVNFTTAGQTFSGGGGFVIGTNVITTFGGGSVFANASGVLPTFTIEDGGYLNLGSSNNANSQSIRSLSGIAGYVTSLANSGSPATATLTISNQAGDNTAFAGQIVDGSTLNGALGTSAANVAFALTKQGGGTQVLSGNNTYSGNTLISAGVLTYANTNAKSVNSSNTVSAGAVIGLGVGGVGGYDAATITSIISNSASGYNLATAAIVGIDTTAGNFSYGTGIANSRELWKLGANTLTLTAGSGRSGATVVTGGTLELNATSGQAAGGTAGISVLSGANLLISKSEQVNNSAAITLSGGTITRGSGVDETMGNLSLTAASTLNYGTGTAGTLTFGTYTPSALNKLTLNNFGLYNTLQFVGSDLSSFIVGSFTGTSFSNDYFNINGMSAGFTSSWDSGSSTFTITSVPEPSTVLAAIGLTGLLGWPVLRRRLRRKA